MIKVNLTGSRRLALSLLSLAAVLLVAFGAGKTVAWFSDLGDPLNNLVRIADFEIEVTEEFDGMTKEHVRIHNQSGSYAYVRVTLTAVWLDEDGNISARPAEEPSLVLPDSWFERDGIYYYKAALAPDAYTADLISSFTFPEQEGLRYELQVFASGIQATPEAVEEAWAVTADSTGLLTPALP